METGWEYRLGFSGPSQIRKLIKRHKASLRGLKVISTMGITPRTKGGRPGNAFYLNKKQTIFLTANFETAEATAITIEIIERFDAYE